MRARTVWLSEAEKSLIYEKALDVLEHTGMRIAGSRVLSKLAEAGAHVDQQSGLVKFPPWLVANTLAHCPRDFVLAGATPERDVEVAKGGTFHFATGGCAAHALDMETGARRPSNHDDLRKATAILEELPELEVMWTIVTANDIAVEERELREYYTVLTETTKHITFVDCPTHVEEVKRIFEVLAGDMDVFRARPRISTLVTTASPLQVDGHILDVHIALCECGAPLKIYSMAEAGATSPVTLTGTVVQGLAEFLGCATAVQTAAPGTPVVFCFGAGVLDMRHTTFSLGSLENTIMGCMAIEMARFLNVPVLAPSVTTDAKHPGVQAGVEKGLKAFAVCGAGPDVTSGGMGLLDTSSMLYLPQIVVDHEIMQMVRRMLSEVEVTPETAAAEMIGRAGPGGNYLVEKETKLRIRAGEHFMPRIMSRASYDHWKEDGRSAIDEARAKMEELLAVHDAREPYLPEEQLKELRAICGIA